MHKSRTSLNFTFDFNTLYLASISFTCVNLRSQNCISGNQPLDLGQFEQHKNLIIVELTFL